jgi:hypothetical protein
LERETKTRGLKAKTGTGDLGWVRELDFAKSTPTSRCWDEAGAGYWARRREEGAGEDEDAKRLRIEKAGDEILEADSESLERREGDSSLLLQVLLQGLYS